MLAAGDGEDEICLFGNGIVKGIIRGGVAGMECNDHIDAAIGENILGHIGTDEFQPLIAVLPGDFPAALHHIFFQVIADNCGVQPPFHGKIVIQNEGQIGFAAAKIQNGNVTLTVILESLINQFNKTIDLLVLIIFCPDDFHILGKYAQIHQRRDVLSLFEDVFLFPVMGLDGTGQGNGGSGVLFIAAVPL